ncbi:hypothetical protein [Paenibacillus lentus]|uniref:hypothetical protein n=1 Tax=Paenibacillus lentus TaxID=1338368 RepID=UPI0013DE1AC0|nr:hypothetical protein [Paenibacillus lentus]
MLCDAGLYYAQICAAANTYENALSQERISPHVAIVNKVISHMQRTVVRILATE